MRDDKKRILRVLEIYNQTGKTKTQLDIESRKEPEYDYKIFALQMDRQLLYDRINKRVDIMIENGLIEEVETIYNKMRGWRHDYRNHIQTMKVLAEQGDIEAIKDYLNKLEEGLDTIELEELVSNKKAKSRVLSLFKKDKI